MVSRPELFNKVNLIKKKKKKSQNNILIILLLLLVYIFIYKRQSAFDIKYKKQYICRKL